MNIRVIGPDKVILQATAEEVIVTTEGGEVGILDRHAPLVGTLKPGKIRVKVEGVWTELQASKGLLEVQSSIVTILVEE
jgi:F-type H+-transporting ATPase subunit epsilon